jgi:hypothetical protein
MKICEDDIIVSLLRDHFSANILKVPDGQIKPLMVLEQKFFGKARVRSYLPQLLKDSTSFKDAETLLQVTAMANIAGLSTKSVDLAMGLTILGGFLNGFGFNAPNLSGHFQNVRQVSFKFENIERVWFDNGLLGRLLKDSVFETTNPLMHEFMDSSTTHMLLVDGIIRSNSISIEAVELAEQDANFEFDLTAVSADLAKAKAQLKAFGVGKRTITFQGKNALPFAFTCIELLLNDDGKVVGLPTYTRKALQVFGKEEGDYKKTLLTDSAELIELSDGYKDPS